jgi:hypothetical protein
MDNARACPNHEQYDGKVVNGVDENILIRTYLFPENRSITKLEYAAGDKASSGAFALDAILFGRWRD